MSHFPRKPVRFIEENKELLDVQKSVSGEQARYPGTDLQTTEDTGKAYMTPKYRTPADRVNGNEMFRRYPDGRLDAKYAAHKVIDAIHKVRDGIALDGIEKTALSCCFPGVFSYVDAGVAMVQSAVNLRISDMERMKISALVASHLQAEMRFMLSSQAR